MVKNQPMKNGIPLEMSVEDEAEIRRKYPRINLNAMETETSNRMAEAMRRKKTR